MNGYLLIWILLQRIEKLEEELNTYKDNKSKNWLVSSEQSLPALFYFSNKKRYVSLPHI